MIDWISGLFPCKIDREFFGDTITCCDRDGVLKYEKKTFLSGEGSFSSKVSIKSARLDDDGNTSEIYISGNPAKYLQGHNIFGSDDLQGIVHYWVPAVLSQFGVTLDPSLEFALKNGTYRLTRVDCTGSMCLPSLPDVRAYLRSLKAVATSKRQNISDRGDTLYFGQHSRRSTLKFYAKGPELVKHPLPGELDKDYYARLMVYAQPLLRVEATLRSMELKRRNLDRGLNWVYNQNNRDFPGIENTAMAVLRERMTSLNLPEHIELTEKILEGLPARFIAVYELWKQGKDLRAMYSKNTFYRYRREFLKHGIELNCPPMQPEKSNVVPLIRYLIAEWVSVPDWAIGTPLYFDPSNTSQKIS